MKNTLDIKQWVKERNEAFLSMDKQKIINFCKKYDPDGDIPQGKTFWLGVHKVVCHMSVASPEQKEASKKWLYENGSSPDIFYKRRSSDGEDRYILEI